MISFRYQFSVLTIVIVIAVVHLTLETLFTIKFGQTSAGYLPDLIVVALILVGGHLTMKDPNAVGILCGAWGFACCLHYRALAWRFDEVMAGTSTALVETTLSILAVTMPISLVAFSLTLIMCVPKKKTSLE